MAYATHYISEKGRSAEVVTLYRVGLYAIHRGTDNYVVSHLPTGFRASSFPFLYLARRYANLMHQRAGDAGRSCEFGRAPRLGDGDRLLWAHNMATTQMDSLYTKGE